MRFFTVILLLASYLTFAQKEGQALVDSLLVELRNKKEDTSKVSILNNLSFNYGYIDPAVGKKYGLEAMKLSQKLNWNDGLANAYRNIGINVSINSEYPEALQWYFKALKQNPDKKIKSTILRSIGLVYTYMTDYKNALDYDMRALKMSEELGDKKGQAAVLSNIGIVYYDLADFKKAIAYYDRARRINKEMGNLIFLANNLGNLGNSYNSISDYDKAIWYYEQSIVLNDSVGDLDNKAINLGSIADTYARKKDYGKAVDYTNQAIILHEKTGNERGLAFNYETIGYIYVDLSEGVNPNGPNIAKASEYFGKALKIYTKLKDKNSLSDIYGELAKINERKGNFADALRLYKTSVVYKDSVFNTDNKQTIKNLEDRRAIELRDKQIQVNKLRLATKERERWLYIIGIGMLVLIGLLLFYQNHNRRKINRKLQTLNDELQEADRVKTRFFSILNHDLRAPVARLISFLRLQRENPELLDEESRERMENHTMSSAENLLEAMEDMLLWTKGQMENFSPKPRNVSLSDLFSEIRNYFKDENVEFSFADQDSSLMTDPDYLKTILRNLTSNSVKALAKTPYASIKWRAFKENGITKLAITDNGPGASQEKFRALYDEKEVVGIKTGLGLHLIRDLAKSIGCSISVTSEKGEGTTFTLSFQ